MNQEGNAVLEVSRDITAQLQAEEALRETEKLAAMGRVAGIIAHEINNPLAAITNIFYLLRNHPSLERGGTQLSPIWPNRNCSASRHITRQTLSFYRESKQPMPVDVHELLDDVLELQERAFQANQIMLRKKYSNAEPRSRVSRGTAPGVPQPDRAMRSRRCRGRHAAVARSAKPPTGSHGVAAPSVSIIDTGSRHSSPRMPGGSFEPFFSTKSTKGTGLGLWISKGIVQKYNGRISYRSFRRDEKNFTCFRVFIPGNGTLSQVADPANDVANNAVSRTDDAAWQKSESVNRPVPAAL